MRRAVPKTVEEILRRIGDAPVVASMSGGKDSGAMSLYLTELGIEHHRVFADTGWENPATLEYLRGPLTKAVGPITEVRAELQMEELVRKKAIFPDREKRFCTVMLKMEPIRAFRDSFDGPIVFTIGIRADESEKRKNAKEWEFSDMMDAEVWRPILRWSVGDVLEIHKRHGLALNPLYAQGATRVGCWPCIHARKAEIRLIAAQDPERIALIDRLEHELTQTARDRVEEKGGELKWERTFFSAHVGRNGHRPMPIGEAVAWANSDSPADKGRKRRLQQVELFADPNDACGGHGLCESTAPELRHLLLAEIKR